MDNEPFYSLVAHYKRRGTTKGHAWIPLPAAGSARAPAPGQFSYRRACLRIGGRSVTMRREHPLSL